MAAGSLYNLVVVEEACMRLGLASEPRTVTPGRRPVMEIAGIPHELIDWTATRSRSTRARLAELEVDYRAAYGHAPDDEDRARLSAWAADDTRPPKRHPAAHRPAPVSTVPVLARLGVAEEPEGRELDLDGVLVVDLHGREGAPGAAYVAFVVRRTSSVLCV